MNEQLKNWLTAKIRVEQKNVLIASDSQDAREAYRLLGKLSAYRDVIEMLEASEAN